MNCMIAIKNHWFIVENGMGNDDVIKEDGIHDTYRIAYLRDHIKKK